MLGLKESAIHTVSKYLPLILKVLEFLRPKFYNRLTWVIVIAGLALISTPLWQDVVKALIERELHISIGTSNAMAWGFALCCAGLVYHLLSTGLHEVAAAINSKAKTVHILEHDRRVFTELHTLLSESHLRGILDSMEVNHSIRHNNSEAILDFIRAASSSSQTFITPSIKAEIEKLCTAANDLYRFICNQFDEYPYGQTVINFQMCLAPQLNCDRAGSWEDMPRYDELTSELMSTTHALLSSYQRWRIAVKEAIYV